MQHKKWKKHPKCFAALPPACYESGGRMVRLGNQMANYSTRLEGHTLAWIQAMGGDMRRDDDLVRSILMEMEDDPEPVKIYQLPLGATLEQRRVYYHVCLLIDAGLVAVAEPGGAYPSVFRITDKGHSYLAAIRDDTIWKKIKEASAASGKAGLNILADVGVSYLKQKLAEHGFPV